MAAVLYVESAGGNKTLIMREEHSASGDDTCFETCSGNCGSTLLFVCPTALPHADDHSTPSNFVDGKVRPAWTALQQYCPPSTSFKCKPCMALASLDACNYMPCMHGCSGHGQCNAQSGRCECAPGWAGFACDQPAQVRARARGA
ncbi:hypothetical protein EON67_05460 [archaeon]|nr:MAG: hypothetical protein EON67_05460 [archaeon]